MEGDPGFPRPPSSLREQSSKGRKGEGKEREEREKKGKGRDARGEKGRIRKRSVREGRAPPCVGMGPRMVNPALQLWS